MQYLGRPMSDIQWHSIHVEGKDENEVIEHSLDSTAAELHSHFISTTSSDSPAINQHEQFLQSTSEVVERSREADAQIFAQNLMGASLDAIPMNEGVSIATQGIPSQFFDIKVGIHSGISYLRIDREGLDPVVTALPIGREILTAKHVNGRLEIRFSE
tara:strand:+ start:1800 stop:2273 length:474 start_codon:yes stop_codon:yes gene_type:complete